MHCWRSALTCYDFLHKRRLPVAAEAIFFLYLQLRSVSSGDSCDSVSCDSVRHCSIPFLPPRGDAVLDGAPPKPASMKESNSIHCIANDVSDLELPFATLFLLRCAEHQSTLRPLYHRLQFAVRKLRNSSQARADGKTSADASGGRFLDHEEDKDRCVFLKGLLSVLSAPCVIINLSLEHNGRRGRWPDVLRTVHNLHHYNLLNSYLIELHKMYTRCEVKYVLTKMGHDVHYRKCIEPPSLAPLMGMLLTEWETYWSMLKGKAEPRCALARMLSPASSDYPLPPECAVGGTDTVERDERIPWLTMAADGNCGGEYGNCASDLTPLRMKLMLEESSLEVLQFVGLTAFAVEGRGDVQAEEEEVFHRLVEVATRGADFAFCARLAQTWANPYLIRPLAGRQSPHIASKLLLLTRLIAKGSASEDVLKMLDDWSSLLSAGCSDSAACLSCASFAALLCPEVVAALAARLTPSLFREEVVEKRLLPCNFALGLHVQEVVVDTLRRGGFHRVAEEFSVRQACIEVAALCKENERCRPEEAVGVMRKYFSQKLYSGDRKHLLFELLEFVGEPRYPQVVDLLLSMCKEPLLEGDVPELVVEMPVLLFDVICYMITERQRPGDAAVLFRLTIDAIRGGGSTPLMGKCEEVPEALHQHSRTYLAIEGAVDSFTMAVASLGLVKGCDKAPRSGCHDDALQWLKLLSEIPSTLFDEPVLVVWLFWTMKAMIQHEEARTEWGHTATSESVTKAGVLKASGNLSRSLKKCGARAVFPPMLLHWLSSNANISWAVATKWLSDHAGEEISKNCRFAFLRLPLGPAALEGLPCRESKEQLFLAVEEELKTDVLHYTNCNLCSIKPPKLNLKSSIEELFERIRYTLLRAWYYELRDPRDTAAGTPVHCGSSESHDPLSLVSGLQPQGGLQRKASYILTMCSVQRALRFLWDGGAATPLEAVDGSSAPRRV